VEKPTKRRSFLGDKSVSSKTPVVTYALRTKHLFKRKAMLCKKINNFVILD